MSELMTTMLLWALATLGAWNAINMAARVYYKAPWWPYAGHVIIGAWSSIILTLR